MEVVLKQDKATYKHRKTINIDIVYEISKNRNISSYPKLENCFSGAVNSTKYVDIDGFKYSGCGIRFDGKGEFSFGNGFGKNCIIFGVDMSSSVHVDNKKKYILILDKGPKPGLDGTTLTAEKLYSIAFTENNKTFF